MITIVVEFSSSHQYVSGKTITKSRDKQNKQLIQQLNCNKR